MKLPICRGQVDEVIRMREDRQQIAAVSMLKKSADLVERERACAPLHIILHKHLDRGATDGAAALDRHMHATADRHVGAQEQR